MKTRMSWFRQASSAVRAMTVTSTLAVLTLISAQFLTLSGFSNPFLILTLFLVSQTIISGVTSNAVEGSVRYCWGAVVGAILQAAAACLIVADAVGMSADQYKNIASASESDAMATVPVGTGFALLFWSLACVVLLAWSVISVEQAAPYIKGHRNNVGSKHLRKHKRFNFRILHKRREAKKHQAYLLLDLEQFFKSSDGSGK